MEGGQRGAVERMGGHPARGTGVGVGAEHSSVGAAAKVCVQWSGGGGINTGKKAKRMIRGG